MFHVIPLLKMSVHVTYIICIFIEQLREREIFKIGLLYTEQEKCSCKPILLKEKIPDLMQAFPLDMESH